MKTITIAIQGEHPALRAGVAYQLVPVTEEGDDTVLGFQVFNADPGAFILYLDSEQVKVSEA
jgi:hypothetical protein